MLDAMQSHHLTLTGGGRRPAGNGNLILAPSTPAGNFFPTSENLEVGASWTRRFHIMPQHRRCLFGCANFNTLFPFPHNEPYPRLRQQWLEFTHFDEGGVFNNSRLCERHFSDGCFENKGQFTAGFASHLLLSKDAIPSIYTVGNSPPPKPTTRDFGCQCVVLVVKKTAKVQANLKPRIRSAATQTSPCSESVGVGPPVDWKRSPSLLTSTYPESFQPSKKCRLTLDDDECDGDSIEVTLSKWSQQIEKAVPSGDALNTTNDPESSADAIAEIIDFSDESDSSGEGSIEVDEEEHSSVSSDEGHDHNYFNVFDPLEHHNTDDKLPDEGPDGELDSGDHNSDIAWDLPDNSESDTDEKHDNLRKLCSECGMFFYSQAHTCGYKKPLSCIVCGKRYYCEVNLKIHSKIHQDGYKHGCKYCSATFRTRSDKLVHEQSHLPAEKPYRCPDCPEVFAKMRERNDHLVTHRGPKRHICLICNMDFPKNDKLERHVAVHTKVKTFVCEVCQRSFTQSNHLKSHMRVHTGEKPYQCHHCDKSFNHNVSLKSHIQRYHGQVPDPGMKIQMEKTSRNESETEKDETNEMESSAVDAEEDEKSKDTLCNTENGAEEEVQKEDGCTNKYPRPTGRPRGRPKKNAVITSDEGSSDSAEEEQEHDSDSDFDSAGQRSKKKNMAQSCKVRGRCRGMQR